ncbi:hypothetical protein OG754_40295 (plasmid) [Streptomyces decoyicus]|uniref:hypothetical protein n=1 Tax=Streptomyces decoyicus TaxID=249567 RepID=UPI002E32957E|nr:hypothetical protein [Streptomyces decoyicus]
MTDAAPSFTKTSTTSWPLGAPDGGGCCTGCPIREGCALAADTYVVCPITGSAPPPAPHARIPAQPTADDLDEAPAAEPATGRFDITAVASRGVEAAISGAFGFGWTDLATALIERSAVWDSEGNKVDWGRLQIKRNLLCIAVATAAPLGDHTATVWVSEALKTYSIGAVFVPAGTVLAFVAPVFIGKHASNAFGVLCKALWGATTLTARATWRLITSPLGWVITRPAIWAAICGLTLATWRFVVYRLTGAV